MKLIDAILLADKFYEGEPPGGPSAYALAGLGIKYLKNGAFIEKFYEEFVEAIQKQGMLPWFDQTNEGKELLKDPKGLASRLLASELHKSYVKDEKIKPWLEALPTVRAAYLEQDEFIGSGGASLERGTISHKTCSFVSVPRDLVIETKLPAPDPANKGCVGHTCKDDEDDDTAFGRD